VPASRAGHPVGEREVDRVDIVVKGRHTAVPERFRSHVEAKLAKLERYDGKVIRVDVELSREPNKRMADVRERVELTVYTRGPVIRAEAAAADPYSALDGAAGKLAERLRRASERRTDHKHGNNGHGRAYVGPPPIPHDDLVTATSNGRVDTGGGLPAPARTVESLSSGDGNRLAGNGVPNHAGKARRQPGVKENGAGRAAAWDEDDPTPDGFEDRYELPDRSPMLVRTKTHRAEPMTLDDALSNMELVGHDFYLFQDATSGRASVVYRRRGYDYGVIHLIDADDPAPASDEDREPAAVPS
jgi:ribosomal subunit interface protein